MMAFDNFKVTPANAFAHAAALEAAEKPALHNPLVLYGGHGVGKTHLLQAIRTRLQLQAKAPEKEVVYVTGAEFSRGLWDAMEGDTDRLEAYLQRYDQAKALLFDDLQTLLCAKPDWLPETAAALIEILHERKKQIVITADRPPQELEKIWPKLLALLESGLAVELLPPEGCGETAAK